MYAFLSFVFFLSFLSLYFFFLSFLVLYGSLEPDLKIPFLKTTSGQRAFSYRGAKLWNSLERATKLAPSLKAFKGSKNS